MKTYKVALFGCGTVGSGVYRILTEQKETIAATLGVAFTIAKVCVLDPHKKRSVDLPSDVVTTDGSALLDDPSIDIIVEVIGGETEALGIITRALVAGKRVVTANKTVVARHLPLLHQLEELHGGHLFYGAAVCGGIPILKVIDETLLVDRINAIRGVVNGSTNFILSRLADGYSRDEALLLADREGFLEADPTADISGADAAQKLSILAWHAFGIHRLPEEIDTTGIEEVTAEAVTTAQSNGGALKLVAAGYRGTDGNIVLSVAPRIIPLSDPLASVADEVNIIEIDCLGLGKQRFAGRGAGSYPTANAVVSDLFDICVERRYRRPVRIKAVLGVQT